MFIRIKRWLREEEGGGGGGGGETPPAFNALITEDGSFVPGWQNAFEEGDRPSLANFKSVKDFTKSFMEAKRTASGKLDGMIKVPGENATEAEKAAWLKALGVPDTVDEYGLKVPEGKAAQYVPKEEIEAFSKMAHEMGLSKTQTAKLYEWRVAQAAQIADADETAGQQFRETRDKALKDMWGNQVEEKTTDALRMLKTIDPKMDTDDLAVMPPSFVAGLVAMLGKLSPDSVITREQLGNKLSNKDLARDITSNPRNPEYEAYHNKGHPNHRAMVQKVLDMNKD